MREHETSMPYCWCGPIKKVMPNGNLHIIHNKMETLQANLIQAEIDNYKSLPSLGATSDEMYQRHLGIVEGLEIAKITNNQ